VYVALRTKSGDSHIDNREERYDKDVQPYKHKSNWTHGVAKEGYGYDDDHDDGYGYHDDGYGDHDDGYGDHGGGYGYHDDGYGDHDDGYGYHDNGYGYHDDGYGDHNDGYGYHDDGYGYHDDGYGDHHYGYKPKKKKVYVPVFVPEKEKKKSEYLKHFNTIYKLFTKFYINVSLSFTRMCENILIYVAVGLRHHYYVYLFRFHRQ